jgi:hypothetical protein
MTFFATNVQFRSGDHEWRIGRKLKSTFFGRRVTLVVVPDK